VVSNKAATWRVVHGLARMGIPAFGPIWDSRAQVRVQTIVVSEARIVDAGRRTPAQPVVAYGQAQRVATQRDEARLDGRDQTSSRYTISVASERRGPSLRMRV
jgi:hypothetical protein